MAVGICCVSRCLTPQLHQTCMKKTVQISNLRSWFCLGKRHSSLLYATKKQSHERCSVKPCFFQFFKILWLLFFVWILVPKEKDFGLFLRWHAIDQIWPWIQLIWMWRCSWLPWSILWGWEAAGSDQSMSLGQSGWLGWHVKAVNLPGAPQSIRRVTAKAHALKRFYPWDTDNMKRHTAASCTRYLKRHTYM